MDEMQVKVGDFEGPLELLLHLIQKLEIDIYDIPMTLITEQYLAYIQAMPELEWEQASKYMLMAATLLAIKSKMLLPSEQAKEEVPDPRQELVEQLLTYQQYQQASQWFDEQQAKQEGAYSHPAYNLTALQKEQDLPLGKYRLQDLVLSFQKVQQAQVISEQAPKQIEREKVSLKQQMDYLLWQVQAVAGTEIQLQKLWWGNSPLYKAVSFSALLQLMKEDKVQVRQEKNFAPLYFKAKDGEK